MSTHNSHDEMYQAQLKKTSDHWGKEGRTWKVGGGIHWTEHIEVQKRINEKVSGRTDMDPYQYLIELLLKRGFRLPLEKCLTLGCGTGGLERGLAKYGFCSSHDAIDVSEEAIQKAISAAQEANLSHITYAVQDINYIKLPSKTYDVVFGVHSVHHFRNLEFIFKQINAALKDDGIFFVNEYIGPSQFQWSPKQLEIINAILRILPSKYKRVVIDPSFTKEQEIRPTIEEVMGIDPSEAIRSSEILNLLKEHFEKMEIKYYGGTVLHPLLLNITGNFDPANEVDVQVLKSIFTLEDAVLECNYLCSDFAVIIATKKPASAT